MGNSCVYILAREKVKKKNIKYPDSPKDFNARCAMSLASQVRREYVPRTNDILRLYGDDELVLYQP